MDIFWVYVAVILPALASLVGTEAIRRYALRTSMVDIPNHRSSHTVPTPRGGGIAVALSILSSLAVLFCVLPSQRAAAVGVFGGGLLIAGVGLLDDRFDLSARLRLLVQFTGAGWLIAWTGGVPLQLGSLDVSILASLVAIVFVVWCTNLYNFMDGLDGFAGSQALIAAIAAGLICFRQQDALLALTMFATAGAAAGFLVWNWPPAKIFMGDCGSGFLGFLFGALAVVGHGHGSLPNGAGLILLMVFMGDATLTLLRRMLQGEAWSQPHRSHAYQLATRMGASHRTVTLIATLFFLFAALLALNVAAGSRVAIGMALGYAVAICIVWSLINRLFVGRGTTLASITESRPVEMTEARDVIIYFRFKKFQSRLESWRSIMPQNDLLSEATDVASDLGYTVSHDWLDGCGGGRCEAAGEKWILLDFNMSKQDQTRQILLAIHDELNSVEEISPKLRTALDLAVEYQSPLRKAA